MAETPLTVPSPGVNYAGNYAISTVLLTDIDNDGNGDILALYHNLASTHRTPATARRTGCTSGGARGMGHSATTPFTLQLSRNYYLAAVADMNGDTLPDIVLSDGYIVEHPVQPGRPEQPAEPQLRQRDALPCRAGHQLADARERARQRMPDLVVANGGATISNPIVLGGAAQTSATLPVNPDVNTGGITVLLNNITALQTTGTLNSAFPHHAPSGRHSTSSRR